MDVLLLPCNKTSTVGKEDKGEDKGSTVLTRHLDTALRLLLLLVVLVLSLRLLLIVTSPPLGLDLFNATKSDVLGTKVRAMIPALL